MFFAVSQTSWNVEMFIHVAIKVGNKHKTWLKKHLRGAQIENVWMLKMQIIFVLLQGKGKTM